MQRTPTYAPSRIFTSLAANRSLVLRLTRREIIGRYKGSVFGLLWSLLNPLLMLTVYTFVFGVVFKGRWGQHAEQTGYMAFALNLFAGLIVHSLFAECINRSPVVISGNPQYVKKVIFPLDVYPWVIIGTAAFHTLVSTLVLLGGFVLAHHYLNWTVIYIPVVLLPYMVLLAGFSWFLASFGVYVRDVVQIVGILTTVMLFMSPVFYPVTALPEYVQPYMYANPLTFIIEQYRAILLHGESPDWAGLGIYLAIATGVAWFGLSWFQATRKGFADVI